MKALKFASVIHAAVEDVNLRLCSHKIFARLLLCKVTNYRQNFEAFSEHVNELYYFFKFVQNSSCHTVLPAQPSASADDMI
jgi:hypothetical protein